MDLLWLVVLSLPVFVPTVMYFSGRSAGREMWGLLLNGYEKQGSGAYRAQMRPVWREGKPPISVRLAALSSFILGQMVVPGALSALIGLLVSLEILSHGPHGPGDYVILAVLASAPTGLMIGGRLLGLGLALLQRTGDAVEKARAVARFSMIHNAVLILVMGLIYSLASNDAVLFPVMYACVSIGQAMLLFKAARDIEAHGQAEERDRELAAHPPQWVDRPA